MKVVIARQNGPADADGCCLAASSGEPHQVLVDSFQDELVLPEAMPVDMDVRVIHLVRDVRSWLHSRLKAARQSAQPLPELRTLLRWWYVNRKFDRVLQRCGRPVFRLGYEELALQPERSLRLLCQWLDCHFRTDVDAGPTAPVIFFQAIGCDLIKIAPGDPLRRCLDGIAGMADPRLTDDSRGCCVESQSGVQQVGGLLKDWPLLAPTVGQQPVGCQIESWQAFGDALIDRRLVESDIGKNFFWKICR